MTIERIRRLSEAGRLAGMDAVVLMPGANLRYLTGLSLHGSERLTLAIIPTDGADMQIVLPALEQPRAQSEFAGGVPVEWFPWGDDEGPRYVVRRAAAALIGRTIGVEYTAMRVMELRMLEEAAGVHIVDVDPAMAGLRMHKSAQELELMREAMRIVEAGLRVAIESIKPGRTEREIVSTWEEVMRDEGSDGPAFPTIVASGPNSANPHHTTSNRVIEAGDLVILDGGATYRGYCSDITRTVAVGWISEAQRELYQAVHAANQAGVDRVRPGVTGAEIDRAARQVLEDAGFGQYFIHRTGHGLGMEIHEPPYLTGTSHRPLGTGAVFTIEPGAYVPGLGGVRIEGVVVLTADGGQRLTTFDRELRVLK